MLHKIILPAIVSLTFISCKSQKKTIQTGTIAIPQTTSKVVNSTYPTDKPEHNVIRLVEKQNIFLNNQQMNVTFKRVLSDNRCPMNVRCIWFGNATVEIELMSTTSRPMTFEISIGNLRDNLSNNIEFSGYKFTLKNLYPNNSTDMPPEKLKGKYVIDLKIEKVTK